MLGLRRLISSALPLALSVGGLLLSAPALTQPPSDWRYYRPLTVDNAGSTALVDHPVRVELVAPDFDFAAARPDGADLRFLAADRTTRLEHWLETWDPGAGNAVAWVRVPELPAAGAATVYLLHGNPGAADVSDGAAVFPFHDDFEDFATGGLNAPDPLVTPTYDGSGQVVHPDVVRVPGGWRGYEYWMAMTPYPDGNDDYENPSVIVSHDGIAWLEPPGIVNPLAPEPPGHNDDTDMLLVDGVMRIYYNETNSDGLTYMSLLTSTDGVNWTGPQTVFTRSNYVMSPTVLYEDGVFTMWYVHSPGGCSSAHQDVYLRTSTDGVIWDDEQLVDIDHPGRLVWHFDVVKVDGLYRMLYIAYPDGSNCGNTSLYHAYSGDRLTWTVEPDPVLTPSAGGWDGAQIYRASFLVEGGTYRIWYSARSSGGQWRVGYAAAELAAFQDANRHDWDEAHGQVSASAVHARSGTLGLREDGGSPYPQVFENVDGAVCFSAWLYDDLGEQSGRLNVLRVWDSGTPTYPLHAIGVGVYTGQSTSHYVFHTEGWSYTTTSLAREMGWRHLSIRVRETACDLLIDGEVVGTLDVLIEPNVSRVSLEGFTGGPGWFDDAYVRPYAHPDPAVTVGPAATVAAPPAVRGAVLEPNRPNPLNPGTEFAFRLERAGAVRLDVVDLQGRRVRSLCDGVLGPGRHTVIWDGRDDVARRVASGTYVYRLVTPESALGRKLVVVR